jgi:hypothetical protein
MRKKKKKKKKKEEEEEEEEATNRSLLDLGDGYAGCCIRDPL